VKDEFDFVDAFFVGDVGEYGRVIELMPLLEVPLDVEGDDGGVEDGGDYVAPQKEDRRHVDVAEILGDYEGVERRAQLDRVDVVDCQIGK